MKSVWNYILRCFGKSQNNNPNYQKGTLWDIDEYNEFEDEEQESIVDILTRNKPNHTQTPPDSQYVA